ncbi:hypothetical protein [Leptolyngbya iicbica]|nr:hypothetical protein [Leptolyngbya sp. LK]
MLTAREWYVLGRAPGFANPSDAIAQALSRSASSASPVQHLWSIRR